MLCVFIHYIKSVMNVYQQEGQVKEKARWRAFAGRGLVFNIARFLTPVLFILTFVLAAFVIAFIIINHAPTLFLTRIPAGILTRIPRFTTLMRLFGGLRHVNTTTGKQHQPGSNSK